MKKLIFWLIILLLCQFAFAIRDNRSYVNASQYYEMGNYIAAKSSLEMILAPDNLSPEYALLYGKIHLAMGDFVTAHRYLAEYGKNSLGSEPQARENLLGMIYEASLYQEYSHIASALGNLRGNINTSDSEYAPVLTPDDKDMFFSSMRRNIMRKENIFLSTDENRIWSDAIAIEELNTDFNESIGSLSVDGNTAYLFGYYGKSNTNGDIYQSSLTHKGIWTTPALIAEVSSPWYDLQPHVHKDKVMVLTSNRHDKHDNYDLYVSEWKNGTWSEPVNLGVNINTSYDEQTPFISPCGKYLYFTSNGHLGFGGNDIFVSERIGDSWTRWTEPKNLGPIINSVKDDRYYSVSPDGSLAYLSSNRTGGLGMEDIYFVDLALLQRVRDKIASLAAPSDSTDVAGEDVIVTVTSPLYAELNFSGIVVDNRDNPLQTDIIWIYSIEDKTFMRIVASDEMGYYAFSLPGTATDIGYEVNTPGYKKSTGILSIPKDKNDVYVKIVCFSDDGLPDSKNLVVIGKVLDEDNRPVPCLVRWSYVYNGELNEVLVEANDEGSFKLYVPKVPKLKYTIDHPSYALREEIISLPPNLNSYDTIIRLVSLASSIKITGKIQDEAGNPLIADIFWIYTRNNEIIEYRVVSGTDGSYSVTLPNLDALSYRVAKANYMQISADMVLPLEQKELSQDFVLQKLVEEAVFKLDNVQFEFAKAILTPASIKILGPVLATMKANESLEIELSGHTDSIGSKETNLRLSDARAKAVATHLIENGIDAKRIISKGYGLEKPIATNKTPEGRAQNRRTELKILGIEYTQDQLDGYEEEFDEAGKQARIVKTISSDANYATTQTGIPIALEEQFKAMALSALAKKKEASLQIDLFIDNGKIKSANVRDLKGNLEEELSQYIADMLLGWKVQSNERMIYSFKVSK